MFKNLTLVVDASDVKDRSFRVFILWFLTSFLRRILCLNEVEVVCGCCLGDFLFMAWYCLFD